MWVDKYRPKLFSDIIGQEFFVSRIKAFLKTQNLPHLLLAGAPGTGKTTTALVIARELYGEHGLSGNFLELNASDDRGIDVIRNEIKEFAKLKGLAQVPYKIICLDEADSLTKEAQQALRRTMERYSSSCRFVLACNEISKILDPIQSRCVIFKFKPLQSEHIVSVIEKVTTTEGLTIDAKAKQLLVEICGGDLRKLINTLQAISALSKQITVKHIEEVIDFVNPKEIEEMISYAMKSDFFKARDKLIEVRVKRGFTGLEVIKEMYRVLMRLEMDPKLKIKIIDKLATVEFRIVEGSDEELQIEALLATLALAQSSKSE